MPDFDKDDYDIPPELGGDVFSLVNKSHNIERATDCYRRNSEEEYDFSEIITAEELLQNLYLDLRNCTGDMPEYMAIISKHSDLINRDIVSVYELSLTKVIKRLELNFEEQYKEKVLSRGEDDPLTSGKQNEYAVIAFLDKIKKRIKAEIRSEEIGKIGVDKFSDNVDEIIYLINKYNKDMNAYILKVDRDKIEKGNLDISKKSFRVSKLAIIVSAAGIIIAAAVAIYNY